MDFVWVDFDTQTVGDHVVLKAAEVTDPVEVGSSVWIGDGSVYVSSPVIKVTEDEIWVRPDWSSSVYEEDDEDY